MSWSVLLLSCAVKCCDDMIRELVAILFLGGIGGVISICERRLDRMMMVLVPRYIRVIVGQVVRRRLMVGMRANAHG